MTKQGKLFVISGPSGVGKNTILEQFENKHSNVKLSISCTTRTPRKGEVDGVNYFFTTKDDFINAINNDEFLEWAEFSGNLYGTKKSFVLKTLEKGENLILEIDSQGAFQIKQKLPEAILIFINPPSIEELEKRLRGRNTETEDAILSRLSFAKKEILIANQFDYNIINTSIESAVSQLEEIFYKECNY